VSKAVACFVLAESFVQTTGLGRLEGQGLGWVERPEENEENPFFVTFFCSLPLGLLVTVLVTLFGNGLKQKPVGVCFSDLRLKTLFVKNFSNKMYLPVSSAL
jgi:hypothetical protein